MDVEQREHVVSGFAFYSEKDAGLAEQERQKIAYLDKHIDHADMQSVLAIYKKRWKTGCSALRWDWST